MLGQVALRNLPTEILIRLIPKPIRQLMYSLAAAEIGKISESTVDAANARALAIMQSVLDL